MVDEYTPGKAHEDLVELIWANVPAWDYPTDVDRLAEAIDRYFLREHDATVLESARNRLDAYQAVVERVEALVNATEPWGDMTDAEWVAALQNILKDAPTHDEERNP